MGDGDAAGELAGLRIHDLRHNFASFGAGGGMGLPIIGKLLGHTQAATTQRYAHLDADPLRRASNAIGNTIAAAMGEPSAPSADVIPLNHGQEWRTRRDRTAIRQAGERLPVSLRPSRRIARRATMEQIPEGYISTKQAFALLFREKHPEEELAHNDDLFRLPRLATAKAQDAFTELSQAFWKNDVPVKLRRPKPPHDICDLATTPWSNEVVAHYVITHGKLPEDTRDNSWAYVPGVTPFILKEDFDRWSNKVARTYRADDPFRQVNWTYGQAIAWIVFRTSDGVRRYGSSYALQAMIEAADADDGLHEGMTVADAHQAMLYSLQAGHLVATGIHSLDGARQIKTTEWAYLQWMTNNSLDEDLWKPSHDPLGSWVYRDVKVRRDDLLALWRGSEATIENPVWHTPEQLASGAGAGSLEVAHEPVVPALVKQAIAACLRTLKEKWEAGGEVLSAKTPMRAFQKMVTDQNSPLFIPRETNLGPRNMGAAQSTDMA